MKCPNCLNNIPKDSLSAFTESFFYGDGGGEGYDAGSFWHNRHSPYIVDECPICYNDIYVEMWIPDVVQGEPIDSFDVITFFDNRDKIVEYRSQRNRAGFDDYDDTKVTDLVEHTLNCTTYKEAKKGQKRKHWKFIKWILEVKEIEIGEDIYDLQRSIRIR